MYLIKRKKYYLYRFLYIYKIKKYIEKNADKYLLPII